ncbi:MAG: N(G),N(G)-dimethylarginine dimethylaminohydrolase [Kordiimonadaceae bacterium]|jgi:dimethylargininase|nr:N(G),N(G)-dimethylarginine dimethylaminohydrolase [Kordiimonadaceae bacterium]MBT6035905.1 N(G),N(G)-dimethylarginine dimethylaminohydrolase [Kordiimonadaceae bacterium]MBT6329333.1 N(G),N(G)-dimethylarginine dimethylaminohydrolase [Kordiimonadaceae bacterium]MBT7582152.1 N(G),N(G)-dimethylarginine dimethylaminohydrolase [Kordiimonadaceae bacterium]
MFKNAIVRKPCKAMIEGLSDADLGEPDFEKACAQHDDYIEALKECGLEVMVLEANEDYPDSCFVEDPALMTPHCAILTNPGAISRRGEVALIKDAVSSFYENVERIISPGFVEAGDIMMVGDHYYIGLSARTNQQGADQMIAILEKYGMTGSVVTLSEVLHLKTGLGYLENNNLVACGEFLAKPEFQKYDIIEIDPQMSYSANSVWINATVLVPKGYSTTVQAIIKAGYAVREVNVSEYRKIDGGLSCLSLRF